MNQIKFSHNWNNKLEQPFFTTIRRATPEKREYYLEKCGSVFDVLLNGESINKAVLIDVQTKKYTDIDYYFLVIDTGNRYPKEIFQKFGIENETECLVLLFQSKEMS